MKLNRLDGRSCEKYRRYQPQIKCYFPINKCIQLQIEPDLLLITQLEYSVKNYNDKNYVLLLSLLCQQPIQSIHQSSKPWILHREKYPQHFQIKTWTSSIQSFKSRWTESRWIGTWTIIIAVLCLPNSKYIFFLHNTVCSRCHHSIISWSSSRGGSSVSKC